MSERISLAARGPACLLLVIFLAALAPGAAVAANYYVSPSGSNSNPGSQSQPWATLQYAANSVGAGDNVYVLDGTYVGFDIRGKDGTSANPITFKALGSNVVINKRNSSTPDNINIEGVDYVTIDGFTVRNSPRVGIRCVTARGCIIRNNRVINSSRHGILTGFAREIQVLDNFVNGTNIEDGIYISNGVSGDDNPIVAGNEVTGTQQNGIHVNGDCYSGGDGVIENILIEGNYIHECGGKGMDFASVYDGVIRNNLFVKNATTGGAAGAIHIYGEIGCGLPSRNCTIVNNTIFEDEIAGIRLTDASYQIYIFNNLIVCPNDPEIADEVGGNMIDGASNITRNSTSGLFADAAADDYHLGQGSPAIDAGKLSYQGKSAPGSDKDGGLRPYGGTIDVGAYELGSQSAVAITAFDASYQDGAVYIDWAIGSADGLEGFNVYRALPGSPEQRLNDELIAATAAFEYSDDQVLPGQTYTYRLGAVDRDGEFFSFPVAVRIPKTAVRLDQNVPNPFNPLTTISFYLDEDAVVALTVFDAKGRVVRHLLEERRSVGDHTVTWNGTNDHGIAVASGVYFYRLQAGNQTLTRKAVLTK